MQVCELPFSIQTFLTRMIGLSPWYDRRRALSKSKWTVVIHLLSMYPFSMLSIYVLWASQALFTTCRINGPDWVPLHQICTSYARLAQSSCQCHLSALPGKHHRRMPQRLPQYPWQRCFRYIYHLAVNTAARRYHFEYGGGWEGDEAALCGTGTSSHIDNLAGRDPFGGDD